MNNAWFDYMGILISLFILLSMILISSYMTKGYKYFEFDAEGQAGNFEKLLTIYLDIVKFIIGLGSGSIVLLIGTSSLRENSNFPSTFSTPLYIISMSILYGVLFMVFITTNYESYRHNTSQYLRYQYIRNLSLGYSCLLCFSVGYIWLIWTFTR